MIEVKYVLLTTPSIYFFLIGIWLWRNEISQGKFEEDRYLKQQEEKWCENLRAQRAQEEYVREVKYHEQVVEPIKKDFADLLAKTGDRISDEGLENLAKSRLVGS